MILIPQSYFARPIIRGSTYEIVLTTPPIILLIVLLVIALVVLVVLLFIPIEIVHITIALVASDLKWKASLVFEPELPTIFKVGSSSHLNLLIKSKRKNKR